MEQGLRAYLAEKLGADDIVIGGGDAAYSVLAAEIGGKVVSLHCNVSADPLPTHLPWIVCGVVTIQHQVQKLYMAQAAFAVSTPQGVGGLTDAHHRAVVAAVRGCFPDMPALYAALAAGEEGAQAALDAALLDLQACSGALQVHADVAISQTSAWFVDSVRDGIVKDKSGAERWEAVVPLKLALQEL